MICRKRLTRLAPTLLVVLCFGLGHAQDQKTLKISIPRGSQLTPVQRLNRDGVDAVRKQQYEKAEGLFYKAYLYDPSDPFTLNNLGYIAELQGQLDRAQRFYKLAAEQGTNAFVDLSNEKELQGKRMSVALDSLKDLPMRINRMNFDAMTLLSQNRGYEAETLLQTALKMDPQNVFTMNNLGVASEATGDYDQAMRYYNESASARSTEPAVVTLTGAWRGKPVSQMAAANAQRLEQRMQDLNNNQAKSALLASRGVAAINRNDWKTARQDFIQAYTLNPYSAFSLNNAGYVAEHDGDVETAEFFYSKAQQADDAHTAVGSATQHGWEGNALVAVAGRNDQETEGKLDQERETRHRQTGPIQLLHRDGTPVAPTKPAQPVAPPASSTTVPRSQP
ncbi:MAG TPA: tetratricopeptide repeat protein [Acidobacteriaceae bacterium]|jgi:Flp pilus assembly protein TadD